MKHEAIRAHIQELIDKRAESLMEDDSRLDGGLPAGVSVTR